MYIPVERKMGSLQPVDTLHMSLLQSQVLWHLSPYVGNGHVSVHLRSWYPGLHSETQNRKWTLKLRFSTFIVHICKCICTYITRFTCLLFELYRHYSGLLAMFIYCRFNVKDVVNIISTYLHTCSSQDPFNN